MTHPACMTQAEHAEWFKSVRLSRCMESPCDCCTRKYQTVMTAAGLCDEAVVRAEFTHLPGSRNVKRSAGNQHPACAK